MRMEAQMHATPPQACSPGLRPPPLQWELPVLNRFPYGFRPPFFYNEALHPQSYPPGFRHPVQHAESFTILQPETNFLSGDSIKYSPEFRLDDRQGDHVGIHDFMWGSSMCGALDRHGWYPNESSSGAGRVCGSCFADSPVSKPSILPRGPQHEHVPNLDHGAGLENENWRRETHLQHGQPNSASVPVLNVTPPLASSLEAFWPGKFLASTREAGKRRSFEVSDDTSPPFKRLRTGHEVGSPTWARSRRESEMSWSNGLQMYSDHEASHSSSLHTQKQTERKKKTESSSGTVNRWHDRQESMTRCSPPHYQRGLLSHRDRNRVPISLEVFQKSELCSRPSLFRPISQSDRSSLRASPRPVYLSGKEEQYRNNPCFDARRRASNRGSWSPRLSLRSRSPNGRSNYYRRSLRAGEPSWRRDSWPPCLLAGKSSSEAGTDTYFAYWRSADRPDKVNSKAEEDGSWTTLLSARVGEEHAKDDRSRRGSQFLDVVSKQKSQQCGTEGSVALKANNSLDNMAPASTDRIKDENVFSFPLSAGTIQKLPEMKPKAEQCRSLEKNLPLLRNSSQFSDEKASSSFAKHMTTFGENQSAGLQSISATSLKRARYFTNTRSAPKYCTSQDSEMDWKTSPEKITHQGRRTAVVSAGPLLVQTSGSDEGSALPAEEQDEAEEGEILHTENTFKPVLDSRLLLESSSIASETGIIEGGLIKPFIGLSGVSFEATVHPLSTVDGTDNQVTTVKGGSCGNQIAGKKWIFTGVRSKYIPSVKLLKTASGSDLQTPESLGKSQTPGGCLLAEDTPDCSCSQQMEEASPTSTVRNGRVSFHMGIRKLSDQLSVPRSDLSSLDKDDEIWTAGKTKSDVFFFKDSSTVPETEKPKLSFMVEKSLQDSPVHGQNLERDYFINSGTEDQPRSSFCSSVGDVRVNPVVGKSGSLFDDCRFGITSSIPLVIETNKGFQPNSSTLESSHVSVKSELQDSLTSEGDMQTEKLSGLFRERTTSVIEVAKIVTDKKKTALVQGEQDAKVVSQSSDMRDASAREGDKLARQLDREDRRQGNPTTKLATVLTNTGASLVTKRTAMMSIVPQRSDLQALTNPGGNTRAEQQGKVTVGGSGPATKLVSVTTGEGEATPTDSEDDFEVITESSRDAVTTVLDFDRELGKRRKIVNPENRGNLKQAMIADDPTAKVMKTNVFESSSGTGNVKADLILMKKQMSSLKGGFQRIKPVLKTVDTLPLSSQVSAPSAVTPPLRTLGRSYMTNKTWRREATPVSGLQFSSTPQNPAVVAQPSIYVRKNFSIIRYPASQVPLQSNAGAQPNALSRFPQGSIIQSRNKKYSLSASKSMGHYLVNTIIAKTAVAAAAASPNLKTSITKMSGLGAMPSKKPSPSLVRRLHSVEDGTLVTCSESIASDLPPVSKISPSKPSYFEGSGGLTTSVCSPVSKSSRRATDEMVGYVVSGTRLYRKRKLDQVCVGPSTTSPSPILRPGLEKCDVPLGYIKWKTNKLVRCDHPEASANDALRNAIEGGDQVKCMTRQRRYSTQLMTKTKLGRGICRGRWNPLFPWKRSDMVVPRLRRGRPSHDGKMGALFFHISNQLQKYRSAHPVYTRSADGFSLHRSGVMSKSGANLKWTKSLKTQSILASEAATKVVAEVAKRKRDKKEAVVMAVAEARDERRLQPLLGIGSVDSSSVSSLKPLGIGGTVYVRKGFGNKLVRNSKTVARVVAGEKFRWSLRNARLRRAKKQVFCVYYTRFGVCKRGDGRCLYIHDPEKVAICTKFLRGSCSDPACCLTHKVVPERMSDCSYFLEGLCTNESCPYRHVNVNKEAPVCEAFLRGYCADGDECNKKHTYVCPDYTLKGICTSSNCKLRHPKKTTQLAFASKDNVDSGKEAKKGSKRELRKGRYFTCIGPAEGNHQGLPVSSASAVVDKIGESGDDLVDFISIDEYDSESSKEYQDMDSIISKCYQTMEIYPSNYL